MAWKRTTRFVIEWLMNLGAPSLRAMSARLAETSVADLPVQMTSAAQRAEVQAPGSAHEGSSQPVCRSSQTAAA